MDQSTNTIMMIRPSHFGFNEETAESNKFQSEDGKDNSDIPAKAKEEFDAAVDGLRAEGIEVLVYDDQPEMKTSDAIFPNNWISTHQNKIVVTYAMMSKNRRKEIRQDIIDDLEAKFGYQKMYNFDHYVEDNMFLEGTGSMILDRENRIVYACLSPRTHVELLVKFGILMQYQPVYFHSHDKDGSLIYHTNVMMALGQHLAIVCLESITDEDQKNDLVKSLKNTNKTIVDISLDQVYEFAGNMIELKSKDGQACLVMSGAAFKALTPEQIETIEKTNKILHYDIPTIEKFGGGSIRCMIAEIFKP